MVESIVRRLIKLHEYEKKSLEQVLSESVGRDYKEENKNFQVGDVIFTKYYSARARSNVPKHPIMVITRIENGKDYVQYEGLPIKSVHREEGRVDKSNKNKEGGFPNSLYIRDYKTILEPGDPNANYPSDKESFIDVQDLARFRSYDIEDHRYAYVGHVTDEFYKFALDARRVYKSGGDNSNTYWEK